LEKQRYDTSLRTAQRPKHEAENQDSKHEAEKRRSSQVSTQSHTSSAQAVLSTGTPRHSVEQDEQQPQSNARQASRQAFVVQKAASSSSPEQPTPAAPRPPGVLSGSNATHWIRFGELYLKYPGDTPHRDGDYGMRPLEERSDPPLNTWIYSLIGWIDSKGSAASYWRYNSATNKHEFRN
jgi:hypothetical protein